MDTCLHPDFNPFAHNYCPNCGHVVKENSNPVTKKLITQDTLNEINSWNIEKNFNSKKLIVKISNDCILNNNISVYIVRTYDYMNSFNWQAFTSEGILEYNPIFYNRPNWTRAFFLTGKNENTSFYQIEDLYNSTFLVDFKEYHANITLGQSTLKYKK